MTKEPQYAPLLEAAEDGLESLGLMTNYVWRDNPVRLVFTLARYKFVAKMLAGKTKVLEVGCGDAWASRIVRQAVEHLTVTDFDPIFLDDIADRDTSLWPILAVHQDWCKSVTSWLGGFQAAYALDVLEHIPPSLVPVFMRNVLSALTEHATVIFGVPSLESQQYASPISKAGHVNCMTGEQLREFMGRYFHNVFLFSMNDEVVHTGFSGMAHYLFAIGCTRRADVK